MTAHLHGLPTNMERRVNILLFTNSLAGGGAERVVATLANHWARQAWQVTVVTLEPESADFYALEPSVCRIALNLAGASSNVVDALLQNFYRIKALRKVLKQLRPDVALAMMSTPNVILALAATGLADVRTVGSERCYPPHAPLGRLWDTLRRTTYGRLCAVVALTSECAQWITANSSATQVPVIPNPSVWPLPVKPPAIAPSALCAPGRKVLLAVGRLDAVKNFGVLIDVFARLAERYPDWDLVILGEGPQRAMLEAALGKHKLQRRILVPGIAGNVGQWYEHADLFVMTSRSEGFPNALAEALSHGVAAVSFDCNTGPRDIIRHGIDGLLVPVDDAARLEQALDRLMGDAVLRGRLAARAVEARERFSIGKVAGMWEALFSELTAARPQAGPRIGRHPKGAAHEA